MTHHIKKLTKTIHFVSHTQGLKIKIYSYKNGDRAKEK